MLQTPLTQPVEIARFARKEIVCGFFRVIFFESFGQAKNFLFTFKREISKENYGSALLVHIELRESFS
jgi:hypothetical protein